VQLRPWRITAWWVKTLFVVTAVVVLWPLDAVLRWISLPVELVAFLSVVVSWIAILIGARVFRVRGESAEPRPWWQFTGRPRLSFVVGWACIAVMAVYVITAPESELTLGEDVISFLAYAVIGAAYFTSGVRLRRRGNARADESVDASATPEGAPLRFTSTDSEVHEERS
jgi:hypothetical protein